MEETSSTPSAGGLRALMRACRVGFTRLRGRIIKHRDVDEILQEAFTRSYEIGGPSPLRNHRALLRKPGAAAGFGAGPARASSLMAPVEDLPLADVYRQLTAESPESHVDANRRFMAFCHAVGGLPDHSRRVFVLKKVYGLPQHEIAERLGITPEEVERHIANGLLRCRDYLETIGAPLGADGGPEPRRSAPGPRR